jgi:hypothetical protein
MKLNWGWRIAIVYTAFALATLGMVAFTFTHSIDLVRPDYYEYSLGHDQRAVVAARTAALKPQVRLERETGVLVLALPASHAHVSASVHFARPNAATMDTEWTGAIGADGTLRVPVAGLQGGRWRLTFSWTHADVAYAHEHAFYL